MCCAHFHLFEQCPTLHSQDDLGVEGVIILPESKTKRVRMGTRKSSSRVKQGEHADGKDMDVAHQKNKSNLELEVNTKDSSFISSHSAS